VKIRCGGFLGWFANPRNRTQLKQDQGMATLETALMIPILLAVTFVFISGISVGVQALSLSDATRTAARELARGASEDSVRQLFGRNQPEAQLNISWDTDTVSVESRKRGELGAGAISFAPFDITQSHTAPREWLNAQ
jgi:hypothetical protein